MRQQLDLIHNEKWEILIVFDACRFDVFEKIIEELGTAGKLTACWSPVTHTAEWYNQIWQGRHEDIALVSCTAMPWRTNETHGVWRRFWRAYPLWKNSNLHNDFGQIPMAGALKEAEKIKILNPDKRMLLHVVPPHLPYFGVEGKQFLWELAGGRQGRVKFPVHNPYKIIEEYGKKHGWERPRRAYEESLHSSMKAVAEADWLEGGVITSDHGELLGEAGRYIHGYGRLIGNLIDHPKLHTVPWFRLET